MKERYVKRNHKCGILLYTLDFILLLAWPIYICVLPNSVHALNHGPNLISNPSFEEKGKMIPDNKGWDGIGDRYKIDTKEHMTGKSSVKYENYDPNSYQIVSQKVKVFPGKKYRYSAYIKTKGILGRKAKATVCLEWRNRQDAWIGSSCARGVEGTHDWKRVEGTVRLPGDTVYGRIYLYVRRGSTGQAWFDNLELHNVIEPQMRSTVISPGYRGRITKKGPKLIRLSIQLIDYDIACQNSTLYLSAELRKKGSSFVIKDNIQSVDSNDLVNVSFPAENLSSGDYIVSIKLMNSSGKILETSSHEIVRLSNEFKAKVSIDCYHRIVVNNKPFFPIGMYWSEINEKDLCTYEDSKFNCLMPYMPPTMEQMDLAKKHGFKVIYSLKDFYFGTKWCPKFIKNKADEEIYVRAYVQQFRDHPSLLAWYLNDEMTLKYLSRLESHQKWVVQEDTHHPTWVVLLNVREVGHYLDTCDIVGTDPYPIGKQSPSLVWKATAETHRQVEGSRPLWQVIQAHNLSIYKSDQPYRSPTFLEMRSMAWQAICEGAKGIVFYSFFDLKRNPDVPFKIQWENLKRIAAEIDSVSNILLSIEKVPSITVTSNPGNTTWINWLVRSYKGRLYILVVNNGDGEGIATFSISKNIHKVTVLGENRTIIPSENSFKYKFKKLDFCIFEVH
jgi:hypothetical protein